MYELLSLAVSGCALAISIASAIYSRRQYRMAGRVRRRDELVESLASFSQFKNMYNVMRRERSKTGGETNEHEKRIFSDYDQSLEKIEILEEDIRAMLKHKSIDVPEEFLTQLRATRETINASTHWCQLRYDRFRSFNQNRLPELREHFEEVRRKLRDVEV